MKISPWHMELAKRIAQGQTNRDIMKDIKVSGSRLSVLKANPLFQRQVEKYRRLEADRYKKAVEVFADKAEVVAKEIVRMVESPVVDAKTRLNAGLAVLDRVAQAEGHTDGQQDGEEVVFEQLLRVTKKVSGKQDEVGDQELAGTDWDGCARELEQDLVGLECVGETGGLTESTGGGTARSTVGSTGGGTVGSTVPALAAG